MNTLSTSTYWLLTLFCCLLFANLNAQSPNWLWAGSAGGTGFEAGINIATAPGGVLYVTGSFTSSSVAFGSTVLTNAGSNDIFIAKFDSSGNVLWAKSAGGTSVETGVVVCTTPGGDVYVTGYFVSPSITLGSTVLTNTGNADIFIAKLDSGGNFLWARSVVGTGSDYVDCISKAPGEDVYVAG